MTVEEIRKAYPNPVTSIVKNYANYCVGGAACKYVGEHYNFPRVSQLAGILVSKYNKRLTWEKALYYATKITRNNDEGDFEFSWASLGEALAFQP